jgi:hypothetical protein
MSGPHHAKQVMLGHCAGRQRDIVGQRGRWPARLFDRCHVVNKRPVLSGTAGPWRGLAGYEVPSRDALASRCQLVRADAAVLADRCHDIDHGE